MFPLALAVVVGAILCYQGDRSFTPSLPEFMNVLITTSKTEAAAVSNTTTTISQLTNATSGRIVVLSLLLNEDSKESINYAIDSEADNKQLNEKRVQAVAFACGIALGTFGVGILAALFRSGFLGYIMVVLGFVSLWLNWSSFGIHYSGSILVADFCHELTNFTQINTTAIVASSDVALTPPFVRCPSPNIVNPLTAIVQSRTNVALNQTGYPFPGVTAANVAAINLQLDRMTPSDKVKAARRWTGVFTEMLDYQACSHVKTAFSFIRSEYCYDWIVTLRHIIAGHGIIGIIMVFGVYLGVFAADRFPLPPKRKPQHGPKLKKKARPPPGGPPPTAAVATGAAVAGGSAVAVAGATRMTVVHNREAPGGRHAPHHALEEEDEESDQRFQASAREESGGYNTNQHQDTDGDGDDEPRPLPPLIRQR